MHLQYCGLLAKTQRSYRPHAHDAYEFHYIVSGRGWFEIGGQRISIRAGDFFYTRPGSEHRAFIATEGDYLLQYVAFLELDSEVASDLDRNLSEGTPLRLGDQHHAFFARISQLCGAGDAHKRRAAAFKFVGLLYELMAGAPPSAQGHPAVAWALDLMRSRVGEAYSLDDLVALLGLDKSYFIRLFKKNVGVPPMKYAMSLKMSAAADLLRTTPAPLAVVASQVGFSDEYHFAKCFKQWTGVPPGTYRRRG